MTFPVLIALAANIEAQQHRGQGVSIDSQTPAPSQKPGLLPYLPTKHPIQ